MVNSPQLEILRQGVVTWNLWRTDNPQILPNLVAADLRGMDLHEINLQEADLRGAILSDANLRWADLSGAVFSGGDAGEAELNRCQMDWSKLNGAFLREVDLAGARLRSAQLRRANLSRANMCGADMEGVDAQWADFGAANLSQSNLFEANFHKSNLSDCDFSEANLQKANLSETALHRVDLKRAKLCGASLEGADIRSAILNDADFFDCSFGWTSFCDLDLSTAKGLDNTIHPGPSSLSVDTLYRSGGDIPERFLIGVGIPEQLITYARSLINNPVEFYSCFISYSSKDQALAQRLHSDLQSKGVRCWFAPEDMKIGDRIRPRIDESIRLHDKLLLVLSEHSVDSAWVEQEVETALERERKHGKTVLFPIRLDDAVMEIESGWPALIHNTRHIGDFTRWKDHDAYQVAFERLLRDLKAEDGQHA